MEIEGLSVANFHDKKKAVKKGLSRRYTVVMTNSEGDRVTVTTNRDSCRGLVVGKDIEADFKQAQTMLFGEDEDSEDTSNCPEPKVETESDEE